MKTKNEAGNFIKIESEAHAFIPNPLSSDFSLWSDWETERLKEKVTHELGRLSMVIDLLTSFGLFSTSFLAKEALPSSQIEGTTATPMEVIGQQVISMTPERRKNVDDVTNYIDAMILGWKLIPSLPIATRFIQQIHKELMKGPNWAKADPGNFRTIQVHVGKFYPAPANEIQRLMSNLDEFINEEDDGYPALIKAGIIHAQFEMIHPFLDGNGRVGRMLILFYLMERGLVSGPSIFLATYFKSRQRNYYKRLGNIHSRGDWEGWIKFYLRGMLITTNQTIKNAEKILKLKDSHESLVREKFSSASNALKVLDFISDKLVFNVRTVTNGTEIQSQTVNKILTRMEEINLIKQLGKRKRNRAFYYHELYDIFWGEVRGVYVHNEEGDFLFLITGELFEVNEIIAKAIFDNDIELLLEFYDLEFDQPCREWHNQFGTENIEEAAGKKGKVIANWTDGYRAIVRNDELWEARKKYWLG